MIGIFCFFARKNSIVVEYNLMLCREWLWFYQIYLVLRQIREQEIFVHQYFILDASLNCYHRKIQHLLQHFLTIDRKCCNQKIIKNGNGACTLRSTFYVPSS